VDVADRADNDKEFRWLRRPFLFQLQTLATARQHRRGTALANAPERVSMWTAGSGTAPIGFAYTVPLPIAGTAATASSQAQISIAITTAESLARVT
jgi:hypothetical protein